MLNPPALWMPKHLILFFYPFLSFLSFLRLFGNSPHLIYYDGILRSVWRRIRMLSHVVLLGQSYACVSGGEGSVVTIPVSFPPPSQQLMESFPGSPFTLAFALRFSNTHLLISWYPFPFLLVFVVQQLMEAELGKHMSHAYMVFHLLTSLVTIPISSGTILCSN